MAIYAALGQYLKKSALSRIPMTFREVESVIGRKLPPSAYRHRPWWANEERGHSHAKAWLQVGYETEQVDMASKKLVFKRIASARGFAEGSKVFEKDKADAPRGEIHPMIGALKGTFTIESGWDLTKPALDPEELEAWETKLDRMSDELQEKLSGK